MAVPNDSAAQRSRGTDRYSGTPDELIDRGLAARVIFPASLNTVRRFPALIAMGAA